MQKLWIKNIIYIAKIQAKMQNLIGIKTITKKTKKHLST